MQQVDVHVVRVPANTPFPDVLRALGLRAVRKSDTSGVKQPEDTQQVQPEGCTGCGTETDGGLNPNYRAPSDETVQLISDNKALRNRLFAASDEIERLRLALRSTQSAHSQAMQHAEGLAKEHEELKVKHGRQSTTIRQLQDETVRMAGRISELTRERDVGSGQLRAENQALRSELGAVKGANMTLSQRLVAIENAVLGTAPKVRAQD